MIVEDRTALMNVGKVVMAGVAIMLTLIAVSIVIG
jgi:hypothetical protein